MRNSRMKVIRILSTWLFIISLLLGVAVAEWDLPFDGFVIGQKVSVYRDSDTKSERIIQLAKNTPVTVIGVEQIGEKLWYKILFDSEQRGYIDSQYIEKQVVMMAYNSLLDLNNLRLGTNEIDQVLNTGKSTNVPKDGMATVVFDGIGSYSGNFKEGKRSGNGCFAWDTGEYYDGKWSNDQISGEGTLVFTDGTTYIGTFRKGKLYSGTMEVVQENGSILTRKVKEGTIQRSCILTCVDGTVVEGRTSEKQFSGTITIQYANNDTYVGSLREGLKSGEGTYTWSNGAHYVGNWKNDMMNGTGTYYFSSGKKNNYVKGTFADNNPFGTATYVSSSGLKYDTTWTNGKCVTIVAQKKK